MLNQHDLDDAVGGFGAAILGMHERHTISDFVENIDEIMSRQRSGHCIISHDDHEDVMVEQDVVRSQVEGAVRCLLADLAHVVHEGQEVLCIDGIDRMSCHCALQLDLDDQRALQLVSGHLSDGLGVIDDDLVSDFG